MLWLLASWLFAGELAAMGSPDWRVREACRPSLGAAGVALYSPDAEVRQRGRLELVRRWRAGCEQSLALRACRDLYTPDWCDETTAQFWASDPARLSVIYRASIALGLFDPDAETPAWEAEGYGDRPVVFDRQTGTPYLVYSTVQGWVNVIRHRAFRVPFVQ